MRQNIRTQLAASTPGLFVVTHEEERAIREIVAGAKDAGYAAYIWSPLPGPDSGLTEVELVDGQVRQVTPPHQVQMPTTRPPGAPPDFKGTIPAMKPQAVLERVPSLAGCACVILPDFNLVDWTPELIRVTKDTLAVIKTQVDPDDETKATKTIVLVGVRANKFPPEVQRLFTPVEFNLPTEDDLTAMVGRIAKAIGQEMTEDEKVACAIAGTGLGEVEFEQANAVSVAETSIKQGKKLLLPSIISREKCASVKADGLIEIIEPKVTMKHVAGLENLRRAMMLKKVRFTKRFREFAHDSSGMATIVAGQPGTGKSLLAQALRDEFGIPLIKIVPANIKTSEYGGTQRNWKTVERTLRAFGYCIAWIDEAEGLFGGAESSGKCDGGTTLGLCKDILQSVQECNQVCWLMTMNDIDGVPDPLIDRCEFWSVDLPTQAERCGIIEVHLTKRQRDPAKIAVADVARKLAGYSGRQIERMVVDAIALSFTDGERELRTEDILAVMEGTQPTSVTMADAIERRRTRLAGRARPASIPEVVEPEPAISKNKNGRKL